MHIICVEISILKYVWENLATLTNPINVTSASRCPVGVPFSLLFIILGGVPM